MKVGLRYREFMRGISGWLEAEFDHLLSALSAWSDNVVTMSLSATRFVLAGVPQPVTRLAVKSTAFTVTNDTAIRNVTDLSHQVEAGKSYLFNAVLFLETPVAAGYRLDINGTFFTEYTRYHLLVIDDTSDAIILSHTAVTLGTNRSGVGGTTAIGRIHGMVFVETSGVLRVGFAQSVADPGSSIVKEGSSFTLTEVVT